MPRKNKRKAFSLVEVIISLFIFTIIMMAASQIFAQTFAGYRYTRNLQRDIENAQFIMAILSKELRTSTVVEPDGISTAATSVQFFDHSQQRCIKYRISGGVVEVASQSVASANVCNGTNFSAGNYATVSTGTVTGSFDITQSASSPRRVGKVTMALLIKEGVHEASIQTSVSLRDYGPEGSNLQ
ncbi:MAG: prepilin-type N-terminal cleavage/methylation domain-containing protein [Candidatus Moranbacteria bacterium]|nr:prepilin-type N-terminal cleavage/methylation domain-containing protein [Candidatus Moranbacteria bacterium]